MALYTDPVSFDSTRQIVTRSITHTEESIGNLVQQFKDKPNIESLLKSPGDALDLVAVDIKDLEEKMWLEQATGAALDNVGKILGRKRPEGQSDADYRYDLYTKVLINISTGSQHQALTILKRETDTDILSQNIQVYDAGYAQVTVFILDYLKVAAIGGVKAIDNLFSAGVGTGVYVLDNTCTQAFAMDGDPADAGFGSDDDDTDSGCLVGCYNTDANSVITNPFVTEDGIMWGFGSDESDPLAGEEEGAFISALNYNDNEVWVPLPPSLLGTGLVASSIESKLLPVGFPVGTPVVDLESGLLPLPFGTGTPATDMESKLIPLPFGTGSQAPDMESKLAPIPFGLGTPSTNMESILAPIPSGTGTPVADLESELLVLSFNKLTETGDGKITEAGDNKVQE